MQTENNRKIDFKVKTFLEQLHLHTTSNVIYAALIDYTLWPKQVNQAVKISLVENLKTYFAAV